MSDDDVERQLRRVARGGALGLVGAVGSGVAGFGVVVVVARGFTPQAAGMFFAVTAVFLIVVAVSTLGTEAGFARFLMRYEAQGRPGAVRAAVRAGCVPAMGAAVVVAVLGATVAGLWGGALGLGDETVLALMALAVALPFAVATDLALSVMRAFSRIRSTVVVDRVLRCWLQVLAAVAVVAVDGSLSLLVIVWSASYVVAAAAAVPLALRFLRRRLPGRAWAAEPDVARELWSFTAYRGVARVAQIAIQKADIVLVAALVSPSAAALYTAATRFVALGQIVTAALQQVVQPRYTSMLLREDGDVLREVHSTVRTWNIAAVWPVYVTVAAAPAAYLAIFGDAYAASDTWLVVTLMGAAMLVAVATGPVDTLLLMAGRSGLSLANATLALVVDVLLCLLLLPVLGLVGAAVAWAAAVILRCSLATLQVRRELDVGVGGRGPALAGAAALLCLGVPGLVWSFAGGDRLAAWLVAALVGVTAYSVVLWRLRHRMRLDVLAGAVLPGSARRSGLRGGRRVTSALRSHLPGPVRGALRSCALAWGMLTARWRLTPAFVVAGAQRCGTTTLFRLLAEHPSLVRPTLDKGTGYFDDHHDRGSRWYRAHFPLAPLARRRAGGREVSTFECSGYYMFHPLAPRRIARELPDARVVVVLRDPVERAFSAHGHELARGYETEPFVTAIAAEAARVGPERQRLERDDRYRSFAHRHYAYLGRGEYAGQVAALMDAVGPDRVYVLDADAFFADPRREFLALQEWLGLPPWLPDRVDRWNAGGREPVPSSWRTRLERHFEPHDRALAELLGRSPSWRKVESTR